MDQLRYFVFFMCAFCPSSYQPACNHHSSAASNYITYTMSKTGIKLLELGQVIVMLLITVQRRRMLICLTRMKNQIAGTILFWVWYRVPVTSFAANQNTSCTFRFLLYQNVHLTVFTLSKFWYVLPAKFTPGKLWVCGVCHKICCELAAAHIRIIRVTPNRVQLQEHFLHTQ